MSDHAGLARPCAREDEQRSFRLKHRLLLFRIQAGEKIQAFILPSAFAFGYGATGRVPR
jgi:hypothetical protein